MAVMFMPNSPSPPRGITCNFKSVFKSLIQSSLSTVARRLEFEQFSRAPAQAKQSLMRTLTHVSSASAGTRIRSARRTVGNLWEIDRHCHARACQLTPAHHPIVPIRQTVDHALGQTLHRRGFDPGPVAERVDLAKSNVLTNKQVITHVILEDR